MINGIIKEYFHPIRLLIWRVRWLKWWFGRPYKLGDPMLGKVGHERDRNRTLLWERYNAREPKRPQ